MTTLVQSLYPAIHSGAPPSHTCFRISSANANARSQPPYGHTWGPSRTWVRMWLARSAARRKNCKANGMSWNLYVHIYTSCRHVSLWNNHSLRRNTSTSLLYTSLHMMCVEARSPFCTCKRTKGHTVFPMQIQPQRMQLTGLVFYNGDS